MSAQLSPIVSEFETEEQAASYDRWFRAKVQASLSDPRPNIPHDQVMAEMRGIIAAATKKLDSRRS
ncbi:antitoxin [Pseudomonas aeruginosa]|nr:antitoxin [Pseudomonas aeruginosa]